MTPYYEDDKAMIYHGDCREILPSLTVDYVVSDPPYGIDHVPSSYWKHQRIRGDSTPFDPSHLLRYKAVLFGANHYADCLPPSAGWIVWNKRDQVSRRLPGSDAELAWTNILKQVRIFTHVWIPHTLRDERTVHPTQKPVRLMRRILEEVIPSGVVCDPYMGSGTTLRAAKDLNRKSIGIEIEERYCEIAARRLGQEVLDFGAAA
jgi:site-specific DNA-methyltransferase (adenine-specific)